MKTIFWLYTLLIFFLISCDLNSSRNHFPQATSNENILLFIIPKGECLNCKTLLYKNSYLYAKQQYSDSNIYFLFQDIRKVEAKYFLKNNIGNNFSDKQIIINNSLFQYYWLRLKKKEASIIVIDDNRNILLQTPIKKKVINGYYFTPKE